jgi:hypothetical protein
MFCLSGPQFPSSDFQFVRDPDFMPGRSSSPLLGEIASALRGKSLDEILQRRPHGAVRVTRLAAASVHRRLLERMRGVAQLGRLEDCGSASNAMGQGLQCRKDAHRISFDASESCGKGGQADLVAAHSVAKDLTELVEFVAQYARVRPRVRSIVR